MSKFVMDPYNADTPSTYPTKEMEELFEAILSLQTKEEVSNFFRDLCTMAELREFANRWQIVIMLYERKPYTDIASELNVSTTTVTRVAHWLHEGKGGYQTVADRIVLHKRAEKQKRTVAKDIGRLAKKFSKLRK